MPKTWSVRIMNKINEVAKSPYNAKQVKSLQGVDGYRLRVGDWRVIYSLKNKELEIWVVKVAPRGEVYK